MRRRHEPPRAAEALRDNSVIQKNSTVLLGDCLDRLKDLPDNSVDQIVTDPPYGLKFMGKDWDKAVPSVDIWRECYRVLKPGAFAFIMSSPRQDLLVRMFANLESAGFRTNFTSIYWTYASGFPKAQNAAKSIDKRLGAKPEIVARNPNSRENCDKSNTVYKSGTVGKTSIITQPSTEEANRCAGGYLGFQPKPAVEPIIVVMKPCSRKTYIEEVMDSGKGASWFDDCRIPFADEGDEQETKKCFTGEKYDVGLTWSNRKTIGNTFNAGGRFPANLLVSDDALDPIYTPDRRKASRFFSLDAWAKNTLPFLIIPKPSKAEKEMGLNALPVKHRDTRNDKAKGAMKDKGLQPSRNTHPTVKPVQLMAYLITMGSREGDVVLDPFTGAGTTGMAAKMLGRRFIGVELSEEFHDIAVKRIASVAMEDDSPGPHVAQARHSRGSQK